MAETAIPLLTPLQDLARALSRVSGQPIFIATVQRMPAKIDPKLSVGTVEWAESNPPHVKVRWGETLRQIASDWDARNP